MAVAFSSRHPGYRLGVVLLFGVTFMFFVGILVPQWFLYSETQRNLTVDHGTIFYRRLSVHTSVLVGCKHEAQNGTYYPHVPYSNESDTCGAGYYVDSIRGGWVSACQVFEVIGALALLFACVCTIGMDFSKAELRSSTRCVEVATAIGGLLGFLGCVVFAGKLGSTVKDNEHCAFSWSLFFTIAVSIVAMMDSAVLAIFNRASPYSCERYERIGSN